LVRTLPRRWLESHTVTANSLPRCKGSRAHAYIKDASPVPRNARFPAKWITSELPVTHPQFEMCIYKTRAPNATAIGRNEPNKTYCADCARASIRVLISSNSDTNASVFLPAIVPASISVPSNMTVARSALHARQNLSVFPGSSNNSVTRPHTLHWPIKSCSVVSMKNTAFPFPARLVPMLRPSGSSLLGT
jgi:hypothetical protein